MCRYECYYMCTVCLCCWWWWAVCQLYFLQVNTPTSSVCSCLSGQDRVDWLGNRSKCYPYTLCLNVTWFLQRQHSPQGCLWRGSPPFRLPPSSLFLAQRHNCSKVLLQRSNITQEEQQSAGQEGLQQMKMSVCLMGRPQAMHNTGQDKWKFVTGDKSDLIRDSSWTIAEHTNMSKTGSGGDSWCECLYFLVYSLAVLHAVERRYSVYFCKASGCIFYSLSYKFWHSICKNYIWCVRVWHFKLCSEDAMRKLHFSDSCIQPAVVSAQRVISYHCHCLLHIQGKM